MQVWSTSIPAKARWRWRAGVMACLMALAVGLFGHIEAAGATGLGHQTVIVSGAPADGHPGSSLSTHCMLQGHCSLQALLPLSLPGTSRSADLVVISPDQLALGRTTAPQHHPPKAPRLQ